MKIYEKIFEKMCLTRSFEKYLVEVHKQGEIKGPVYLSTGQESVAASVSEVFSDPIIFPQHRGHSWYLSYGGDPEKLRDEILALPTGCSGGKGGSSDIQSKNIEAHHGFIGENVSIATGHALGGGKISIAVFGDGAAEEDYTLVSLGFAATHSLPILFLCEDNDLAILTKIPERRKWSTVEVAKSFGLKAKSIDDDPQHIINAFRGIELPYYMNIKTKRHFWHVGVGQDSVPDDSTYQKFKAKVRNSKKIEQFYDKKMQKLWSKNESKRYY